VSITVDANILVYASNAADASRLNLPPRILAVLVGERAWSMVRLRDEGYIADDILRRVQRGLDLETEQLDGQH
jgi:hypothetical protein